MLVTEVIIFLNQMLKLLDHDGLLLIFWLDLSLKSCNQLLQQLILATQLLELHRCIVYEMNWLNDEILK